MRNEAMLSVSEVRLEVRVRVRVGVRVRVRVRVRDNVRDRVRVRVRVRAMLSVNEVRLEALRWVAPKGPGQRRGKPAAASSAAVPKAASSDSS